MTLKTAIVRNCDKFGHTGGHPNECSLWCVSCHQKAQIVSAKAGQNKFPGADAFKKY